MSVTLLPILGRRASSLDPRTDVHIGSFFERFELQQGCDKTLATTLIKSRGEPSILRWRLLGARWRDYVPAASMQLSAGCLHATPAAYRSRIHIRRVVILQALKAFVKSKGDEGITHLQIAARHSKTSSRTTRLCALKPLLAKTSSLGCGPRGSSANPGQKPSPMPARWSWLISRSREEITSFARSSAISMRRV